MTSGQGSLFGDVVDWFLKRGDRRQYKRRAGAFHIWWQPQSDKGVPGTGLEISANGLVFMIQQHIAAPECNLVVLIRDRKIPVRVRIMRADEVNHQNKKWHRYMGEFIGISADHWDAVVRYVDDTPEPTDRSTPENRQQEARVDDAYRLLPMQIQQKLIEMLVAQKKLEMPKAGQSPLLKLFYGGASKKSDGTTVHRFNVHSRVQVQGEAMAYDTRFIVDEKGHVEILK